MLITKIRQMASRGLTSDTFDRLLLTLAYSKRPFVRCYFPGVAAPWQFYLAGCDALEMNVIHLLWGINVLNVLLAILSVDLRLTLDLIFQEEPGMTVVASTSSTEAVLALLRTIDLDLLIVQWELPGLPVTQVLAEALTLPCPPRCLVLGKRAEDEPLAMAAGASSYFLIGETPDRLLSALAALRGM